METNPTRIAEILVGLPAVNILGVDDVDGEPLLIHIEARVERPRCPRCSGGAWVKDRPEVELVDLPAFGRPTRIVWRKRRLIYACECSTASFTEQVPTIAPPRGKMTDRAGRWVTYQVGKLGRSIQEVADELGADWHTVNDAVLAYGTALVDDDDGRIGEVAALGLDETLFVRKGKWRSKNWSTSIVGVGADEARLLDVVEGRSAKGPSEWIEAQPKEWRDGICFGVLDLSGPYRKVFEDTLAHATQIADPFHVVKLANTKPDACRRRVQNETLGHRGQKADPLYRARRLLTKAHERLDEKGEAKLMGLLRAGDPHGDVRMAWHAKEVIRSIYEIDDPQLAATFVTELAADLQDDSFPVEVRSLGRTLRRWFDQIVAWHQVRYSNGPTEAINNLIKRVKRIALGFRRFRNYRIRALLYAGRPNWDLLPTVTPR
ncbi:MAG: ISL3 family transposase [Acidobacteria bacterium]|nr:MAG: ISL3 family transposase [Acidobacteriota bacterium]